MQSNFLSARYKINQSIETSNILTLLGRNLHLEIVRQRERDLNFDIFSRQLLNLINELKLKKVNIVGFSIGALIAQHFTEKFYDKVNKLVLIGSVHKRSDKQIETVQKRYSEALNGKSITNDSINRWFSESYLNNNPQVYNFFYKLLEKKKR